MCHKAVVTNRWSMENFGGPQKNIFVFYIALNTIYLFKKNHIDGPQDLKS